MLGTIADRLSAVVTRRPLAVIAVMLLLTAGVAGGLTQLDMANQTDLDTDVFETTEVGEGLEYMNSHYGEDEAETAVSSVYVRPEGENALSRSWLLAALSYVSTVSEDERVATELAGGVSGPPTAVGTRLAGENASLAEQQAAIREASDERLSTAVTEAFADPELAGQHLPVSYEPGSRSAESMRLLFELDQAALTQQQEPLPAEDAQRVLYETAQDSDAIFTMGTLAQAAWDSQQISNVFWLIIPPALVLVLAVLAFAYRDLVDVLLGFTGVAVSMLWFFGILGWLGIPAGFASIVGPILIVALSIDFGLHVFMRYREQRAGAEARDHDRAVADTDGTEPRHGDVGPIRSAMARSSRSVMVAFLLVAVTAGVGFLANVTNPVGFIRAFGVVITLGVFAAALIFVTLVPALKVVADTLLERRGFDRDKPALGTTGWLQPLLSSGVTLARHGALVVVVVALVVGGVGLFAYTELDRQGFQEDFAEDDDWQTSLPEPVGWSAHETEYRQHLDYVQSAYQSDDDRERRTLFLVRGNVTDPATLERLTAGASAARDSELTFAQGGEVATQSPLSLLRNYTAASPRFASVVAGVAEHDETFARVTSTLAAEDEAFGAALEAADPAPVEALTAVYDAMYEAAPEETARLLERRDGAYESMRLAVPVQQGLDIDARGEEMHDIADEMETANTSVVPVDFATVSNAGLGAIADSILWTMLLAFGGVAVVLAGTYHLERGAASLGAVTLVPIVLVLGLVFGGMYLFEVPLTFVTAFLVSITIGLGIDYNIHVSDRFAQELDRGRRPVEALHTAVQGTGGALLGSALTSSVAFVTLLAHPSAVFQSFGAIVVLALALSFVVSVLVLPSFLLLWARRWPSHLVA